MIYFIKWEKTEGKGNKSKKEKKNSENRSYLVEEK